MQIIFKGAETPSKTIRLRDIPMGQIFTGKIGDNPSPLQEVFYRTGKGIVDLINANYVWEYSDTLIRDYLPRKAVLTLEGPTP